MEKDEEKEIIKTVVSMSRYLILMTVIALFCIFLFVILTFNQSAVTNSPVNVAVSTSTNTPPVKQESAGTPPRPIPTNAWKAPDISTIPAGKDGDMIRYGKELIVSTAKYLGPQGSVAHLTNGMNCQNCHLDAGTKLFSNNFAGFMASYPKFSGRSGKTEPASERIAECFERSLNGKVPDTGKRGS